MNCPYSLYNNRIAGVLKSAQASVLLLLISQIAVANPTEGTVVNGDVNIQYGAHTVIQQQSDSAIINWQDFNIGTDEHTQFVQPSSQSVTLNRVIGNNASEILGKLSSNGQIFLVNPNGIVFGIHAIVDVGGLVATTSNISDENFNQHHYIFNQPGLPTAQIINYGHISTITDQGLIALVAPNVRNAGVITAKLGKVAMGAGDQWTLDPYGDNLIIFSLHGTMPEILYRVDNEGRISADGGQVLMTAQQMERVMESIINVDGYIQAKTVENHHGKIVLLGPDNSRVTVSGTLDVSNDLLGQLAGIIQITGEQLWIGGGAHSLINASGVSGGGIITIGGNYQGKGPLPTAMKTIIMTSANILADATGVGNGGQIIVWSDNETQFNGIISAKGGARGGNGGFVETSGKMILNIAGGLVNTLAPVGKAGVWLLDPTNYTIDSSTEATILAGLSSNGTFQILADQDIFVGSGFDLNWSNNATLQLKAGNNIEFLNNSSITNTGAGSLSLRADSDANSSGTVVFNSGSYVNFAGSTGTVNLFYNPTAYTSATNYAPYVSAASGKFNAYMLVNTLTQLQNVKTKLSGSYALGTNINAAGSVIMNGGLGFDPIGDLSSPFTGKFNFNDNSILGLYVNRPLEDFVGLFGVARNATFINPQLVSANITGHDYSGSLVGKAENITVTGNSLVSTSPVNISSVKGRNASGGAYGSLNVSKITGNTVVYANVTGYDYTGGVVGVSSNNIVVGNVFHIGNVDGHDNVGGLGGSVTRDIPIVGLVFQSGTVRGNSNIGGIAGVLSGRDFNYETTTVALKSKDVGAIIGISGVGGVAGLISSDVTNTAFSALNNRDYRGIVYLDNYISRDYLQNGQPAAGLDNGNTNISKLYRNEFSNSVLFAINSGSNEMTQKYAPIEVNAQSIFHNIVGTDLFSGLFEASYDKYGRPNVAMLSPESPVATFTHAFNASNDRLSTGSIMAMGKGVGDLLLSSGGLVRNSFGGNMGASILAMFGVVSMGQNETNMAHNDAANTVSQNPALQAAESGFCGITCKIIMLSMQSPENLNNMAKDINVNPELYVNSGARPNSQMEQKYTWDEGQNRYVSTNTLFKQSVIDATDTGTVIIRKPL